MRPVGIYLKNFLSYGEATLEFPDHPTVICVTGLNGDGKSSLVVDAILFALFAESRGEKLQEVIRDGEKEAMVVFTFAVNGRLHRITRTVHRTSPSTRKLEDWEGSSWSKPLTSEAEVKARMHQFLPYSHSTFVHTGFVLQGQSDRFMKTKAAERQETLSEILGLVGYEERSQVAQLLRLQSEERARQLNNEADNLRKASSERRVEAEQQGKIYVTTQNELKQIAEPLRQAFDRAAGRLSVINHARGQYQQAHEGLKHASLRHREIRGQVDAEQEQLGKLKRAQERRTELSGAAVSYQQASKFAAEWAEMQKRMTELEQQVQLSEMRAKIVVQPLEQQRHEVRKEYEDCKRRWDQAPKATQDEVALGAMIRSWEEQGGIAAEREKLADKLEELEQRIHHIECEDGPCPFCLQEMKGDSREQALVRLRVNYADLQREHLKLTAAWETLERDTSTGARELNVTGHREAEMALHLAREVIRSGQEACRRMPELSEAALVLDREVANIASELAAELAPVRAEIATHKYDPRQHATQQQLMSQHHAAYVEYCGLDESVGTLMVLEERVRGLRALLDSGRQTRRAHASAALRARSAARGYTAALAEKLEAEENHDEVQRALQDVAVQLAAVGATLEACRRDEERGTRLVQDQQVQAERSRLLDIVQKAYNQDGIPALIVGNALPSLAQKANALLDRWTGGRIRIEQKAATVPTGRRSRTNLSDLQFEIWDVDTDCPRPYPLYSGGERFRVDMALRIALAQLLAERAGSPVQMLVIDEGFGTQDPDGLQKMVQIISDLRSDFHSIIVISHIEEIKRLSYDRWVQVVKEDGISRIV